MKAHLTRMFQAGIDACHPRRVLPAHLPPAPASRLVVLALGKAAGEMAAVAEAHYGAKARGVAIVPHGATAGLRSIELLHAGHPVPDEASVAAAERLLALSAGGFVLVLLSGGASALACLPGEGLKLAEKQALTAALLRSGAPVGEVNCVRRHLSRIKGGRLPAHLTLAISDVTGGRPEDIGSGPTVADPTTVEQARAILDRYRIPAPNAGWSETAKAVPGEYRIVARAADALDAAAGEARRLGYRPVLLGECTGDARVTGREHAEAALRLRPRSALISGGELTVTVTGPGRGGPNLEYALGARIGLAGRSGIAGLAADTDGLDGNSGAAGAFFDGSGADGAAEALAANHSAAWFAARSDLFVTGPTGTNVSDLRIILVGH